MDGCNTFNLGLHRRSKEHKFVTLKVYNEVAIELCMACLKFIKKTQKPTEEILFRYFQDIFPPKPLPYLRCVKSLLKFSLILKGDLLTCIAMVQCDLDTTVRLFCPPSQSLISTYNWERKRMIVFCLQVPGHSDRIDKLWNQLRQQLLNNSEDI